MFPPDDFSEETPDDRAQRFLDIQDERTSAQRRNLSAVDSGLKRDQQFLDSMNEPPPEEPQPGFVSRLLDTLDTPHQWVDGVVAKLTGTDGYQDLDLLSAAAKGADENLTAADIFRKNNTSVLGLNLAEHPGARAVAGWFADSALDPLQYMSYGAGHGAQIAGHAVTDAPIATAFGEETAQQIMERMSQARLPGVQDEMRKSLPAGDQLPDWFDSVASQRAGREASQQFGLAREFVDQSDRFADPNSAVSRLGDEEARGLLQSKLVQQANQGLIHQTADEATRATISALTPEDLGKIFRRPTIHFGGPFAGMPLVGQLPLLGTREFDIPIVQDAADSLRNGLSSVYYGTKNKVIDVVRQGLEETKGDPVRSLPYQFMAGLGDVLKGANEKAVNLASLVSRRVQASGELLGSRKFSNEIVQHERDRDWLLTQEVQNSTWAARKILQHPDANEIMTDLSHALEDPNSEGALQGVMQKYAQLGDPKKGADAVDFGHFVQQQFDQLGKQASDSGLINNVRDLYVHHMYDWTNAKKEAWEGFRDKVNSAPDFSLQRTLDTLKTAKAQGFKPDENLFRILMARRYAQSRVFAEKDFAERLAYQWAMPKPAYDRLISLAEQHTGDTRYQALDTLREFNLIGDQKALKPLIFRTPSGNVMDPQVFSNYKSIFANSTSDSRDYQLSIQSLEGLPGFNPDSPREFFEDPTNLAKVNKAYEAFNSHLLNPTRDGETAFARAGATTIGSHVNDRLLQNMHPDDQLFWKGLVPQSLSDAMDEVYSSSDIINKWTQRDAAGQSKNVFTRAVSGVMNFLGNANRIMKAGAIQMWPAFYARNLLAAGVQPGELMSAGEQGYATVKNLLGAPVTAAMALGQNLNIFKLIQAENVLQKQAHMTDVFGKEIPWKQLDQEMRAAGIGHNSQYGTELATSYGDMLDQMLRTPALMGQIPELKKFLQDDTKSMYQAASNWAGAKAGIAGLGDRTWSNLSSFAQRIEAYGRSHLFVNLRQRGFDAQSAADSVNRLMIDYSNGKTAFERNILNKIFFFYSFSRGNASNMAMQLMRNPGALTNQYHMAQGIAELFKDPATFNEDPNAEDAIRSTRTQEGLSFYVGKNARTSLPQFVTSTGMPVEDAAKWLDFYTPNTFKLGDVMAAGARSMNRGVGMLISQSNPLIREMIEQSTGRNYFYDRPVSDITLRKIPKWEKDLSVLGHYPFSGVPNDVWHAMDNVTQEALDGVDNGDGTFTVSPYKLAVLTTLVPGVAALGGPFAALAPLSNVQRFLNTRKALTTPGVTDEQKLARFGFGVRLDQIDPDMAVAHDKAGRMQQYLEDIGIPKAKRDRLLIEAAHRVNGEEEEQ